MEPIYFADRFGWLHRATGPRGVVLCNAGEVEQLNVHRHWGLLADHLAAAGLPTLRFDYRATGDSEGDDGEPDLIEGWVQDIVDAVACLRSMTGVREVVLVGLRLGGMLASLAAQRLGDIDGLVLAATPTSGRHYLRELRALGAMIDREHATPHKQADDGIETAGFRLSLATTSQLQKIDLGKLETLPAKRVLLFTRGSGKADKDLAGRIEQLGCTVETAPFADYAELIQSSVDSRTPATVWAQIVAFAAKDMPAERCPTEEQTRPGPALLHTANLLETPLQFGSDHPLFGVLSEPATQPIDLDRPLVVFLNTGLDHHIGGGRMAVRIGRQLAHQGLSSFRMDTREIGDSRHPLQPLGTAEQIVYKLNAVQDLRAALDLLSARGYRQFVLFGICSGAYLSLHTTRQDNRVVGQLIANLAHFVWPEGLSLDEARRVSVRPSHVMLAAVRRPDKWLRLLTGKRRIADVARSEFQRLRIRAKIGLAALADRLGMHHLVQNEVTNWFRDFSRREVRTLMLFSSGDPALPQLEADLGVRGRRVCRDGMAQLRVIDGANHAMHDRWNQDALQQALLQLIADVESTGNRAERRNLAAEAYRSGADHDMTLAASSPGHPIDCA